MSYKFMLNEEELPKELQRRKIDESIQAAYKPGEHRWQNGRPECSLIELLRDRKVRDQAEYHIQDHLPVGLFALHS